MGRKHVAHPIFTASQVVMEMERLQSKRDEIIELLPKLLQGLSSAWEARTEKHQGINCAKFMEVTARR